MIKGVFDMAKEGRIEWWRWVSPIFVICTVVFGGGSIHRTIKDSNAAMQAMSIAIQANTKSITQNTIGIAVDIVEDTAFQKAMDLHIEQNSEIMKNMAADVKTLLLKGNPL